MEPYKYYEREIHYYETDKMSIVHHSNYARYLEEARIDFMRYYGLPFTELEEKGYMSPVLELHGRFLESIRFGEKIKIVIYIDSMTSARFSFSYKIYDEEMKVLKHTAQSSHCIIDSNYRPVAIKRLPEELRSKLIGMFEIHMQAMKGVKNE